jgi:hypothetical protein
LLRRGDELERQAAGGTSEEQAVLPAIGKLDFADRRQPEVAACDEALPDCHEVGDGQAQVTGAGSTVGTGRGALVGAEQLDQLERGASVGSRSRTKTAT